MRLAWVEHAGDRIVMDLNGYDPIGASALQHAREQACTDAFSGSTLAFVLTGARIVGRDSCDVLGIG